MLTLGLSDKQKKMHYYLYSSDSFVLVDIETTGFSIQKGARIIEIAALKYEKGRIVSGFHQYVNPEQKIPAKITELTGVTNEMVADKLTVIPAIKMFGQYLGDLPLIAHNKSFDWDRFLQPYLRQAGYAANNPTVCTVELSKLYLPKLASYKLDVVADYFNIKIEQHHAGWADVKALCEIVLEMRKLNVEALNDEEINELGLNEKKVIAEPVNFKIKNVSYWEKSVTNAKTMRRLYVTLDLGTVFYDYTNACWTNKDVASVLNFDELEARVIRFKNKRSLEDYIKKQT